MTEWAKAEPPFRACTSRRGNAGLAFIYRDFREQLRTRPGRWAKWPKPLLDRKSADGVAYLINTNRRPTTFPAKEFEARVDKADVLWVRARPPKKKKTKL